MKKIRNRANERIPFKAPITHSMYNKKDHRKQYANGYFDNYHEGMMMNISKGGMVFLSDTPCWENDHIFVNHVGRIRGISLSDKTDPLSGIVVWCKKTEINNQTIFKTGVKFPAQDDDEKNMNAPVLGSRWLS